jgi:hypothetical protein
MCTALDQFRIPAAVVDEDHDRFATWNRSFEKTLAVMRAELEKLHPSQALQPLPLATGVSAPASHTPCQLSHPSIPSGATGRCFRKDEHTSLLILDSFAMDRDTDDFVRGVLVGQQTTHDHLKQTFHDTVSQQVIAATFAVEMLRGKLEGDAVANSEEVAAISKLLQSLFTDLQSALNFQPAYPAGKRLFEN